MSQIDLKTMSSKFGAIIADSGNHRLRKITPDGTVSTLFTGSCELYGVAIDADGCVVVSTEENTVAKIAGCSHGCATGSCRAKAEACVLYALA
jgi:hypothetical protein